MIDTKAIRAKVLDLAIQGKLTEQGPEDGTAEELYQQIQTEKEALIQAGKIKKDKPLPEIDAEDKPFELPLNWKWVRLGNIALQITDGTHHTPTYKAQGIPFLSVKNISGGFMDLSDIKYISVEEHTELTKRCKPERNDVLICRIGTLGKALRVDTDLEFSVFVSLGLIKVNVPILSELIVDTINSGFGSKWIQDNKAGDSMHAAKINLYDLSLMPVPLPPLAEQHRIVAKVDAIFSLLDTIDALQSAYTANQKALRAKLIDAAIRGQLTEQLPEDGTAEELYEQIQAEKQALIAAGKIRKTRALPKITDASFPFNFPQPWKICYIDDIAFVTKLAGFEYTNYIANNTVESGIPLIKGKNVQNGRMVYEFETYISAETSDLLPRSQIRKKCLLTPYVGTIGNIAIFDGHLRAHLGSNVGKIELISGDHSLVLEEFLLAYLRSSIGHKQLTKYQKATAQESISIDAIRNVILPLPPLAEQRRIVARLEELLAVCGENG